MTDDGQHTEWWETDAGVLAALQHFLRTLSQAKARRTYLPETKRLMVKEIRRTIAKLEKTE
jgi:hypothetical protein